METRNNNGGITLPKGDWVRLDAVGERFRNAGFSVDKTTIYTWVRRRRVRAVRLMSRWYINWDDVMALLKKNWEAENLPEAQDETQY